MGLVILLVLIVLLFATVPHYGYSRSWGYYPSGGLGLVLIVVILLLLLGKL